ncbi:MAG: hypothetical protein N3H31_05155 [Candidatus Nezhaarchaeota archaeon]|nr:hypothetical protein [Candidatus Nezhaarchaeota archaeon]
MKPSTKTYKCPACSYSLYTGPYDWLLELEEAGGITCPRCRKAKLKPDYNL